MYVSEANTEWLEKVRKIAKLWVDGAPRDEVRSFGLIRDLGSC